MARLDDVQVYYVVNRRRDAHGNLVRDEGLPPGAEVDGDGMRVVTKQTSYGNAYVRAREHHGVARERACAEWNAWWERQREHFATGS